MNNDKSPNQKQTQSTKSDQSPATADQQQGRQSMKSAGQMDDSDQDIAGGADRMPPSSSQAGSKGGGNAGAQVDVDQADKVSQRDTGGGSDIDDESDASDASDENDESDESDESDDTDGADDLNGLATDADNGQQAVKTPSSRK